MAGSEQKQAKGITDDELRTIAEIAHLPRRWSNGKTESVETAERRGKQDIAMISVMRDALLGVSEAAALRWEDIEKEEDGTGRLYIRRSKTDTEGEGAVAFLSAQTMESLDAAWGMSSREGSVFGLMPNGISKRIEKSALAAGLGEGYSGHSPRVGMARDLARAGTELTRLMTAGRWALAQDACAVHAQRDSRQGSRCPVLRRQEGERGPARPPMKRRRTVHVAAGLRQALGRRTPAPGRRRGRGLHVWEEDESILMDRTIAYKDHHSVGRRRGVHGELRHAQSRGRRQAVRLLRADRLHACSQRDIQGWRHRARQGHLQRGGGRDGLPVTSDTVRLELRQEEPGPGHDQDPDRHHNAGVRIQDKASQHPHPGHSLLRQQADPAAGRGHRAVEDRAADTAAIHLRHALRSERRGRILAAADKGRRRLNTSMIVAAEIAIQHHHIVVSGGR